jgi:hypothetical protein
VSGEDVVMFATENSKPEIVRVGDVDEIVVTEVTIGIDGPVGFRIFLMSNE